MNVYYIENYWATEKYAVWTTSNFTQMLIVMQNSHRHIFHLTIRPTLSKTFKTVIIT